MVNQCDTYGTPCICILQHYYLILCSSARNLKWFCRHTEMGVMELWLILSIVSPDIVQLTINACNKTMDIGKINHELLKWAPAQDEIVHVILKNTSYIIYGWLLVIYINPPKTQHFFFPTCPAIKSVKALMCVWEQWKSNFHSRDTHNFGNVRFGKTFLDFYTPQTTAYCHCSLSTIDALPFQKFHSTKR